MKAADGELSGRPEVDPDAVPQAVQETNALRDRRQALEADASTEDEGTGTPAKSASAEEWKTWAVESGTLTEEEAEKATKKELVEKYG